MVLSTVLIEILWSSDLDEYGFVRETDLNDGLTPPGIPAGPKTEDEYYLDIDCCFLYEDPMEEAPLKMAVENNCS